MFDTKDNKTGLKTVPNSAQPSGWVGGWVGGWLGGWVDVFGGKFGVRDRKTKKDCFGYSKKIKRLKKNNFKG